ncbi:MAG: pyridoxal phosphate-dependent aminotransferase [Nannocystis sp.]|nr:pyridoxal phosphate-dependent aminotransferase [Nannocystis sp.]
MSRSGLIFRPVPRTGVIYVMTEAAALGFRYGHPEWQNLGQGAPETGPLPGSAARLREIALDDASHEYAPVAGLWELREAVAGLYNARYRRGMKGRYSAENVAIAAGGRASLTRVATALGNVHLGHLLPDYTAYEELLEVFRAFVPIPIVLRPEDGFRLAPARLRETIVGAGLGAILLSNPQNPTGHRIAGEELRAWVQMSREFGCALILDEFYAHYVYGEAEGATASACAFVESIEEDPVVVVDGLTKNWRYPGLRISWTVGPKEVIERVSSAGSFLDGGPPHGVQRAVIPMLDPAHAAQETVAIQRAFTAKRGLMLEKLEAMGIGVPCPPEGAFYCFADLSGLPAPLANGMDFFRAALAERVICVPGEFFDVDPGKRRSHIPSRLRSFVRLSFGPSEGEVRAGLDRLAGLVARARAAAG